MNNEELQEAIDSLRDYILSVTSQSFSAAYEQYVLLLKEQVKRASQDQVKGS